MGFSRDVSIRVGILGFLAGVVSTLVFHQLTIGLLNVMGVVSSATRRKGLPVRLHRAPQRGAAFALTSAQSEPAPAHSVGLARFIAHFRRSPALARSPFPLVVLVTFSPATTACPPMISRTGVSGVLPAATARMAMSRSVMMPTSSSFSSLLERLTPAERRYALYRFLRRRHHRLREVNAGRTGLSRSYLYGSVGAETKSGTVAGAVVRSCSRSNRPTYSAIAPMPRRPSFASASGL